ncbi:hypothetical protein GTZ99_12260 [Novosphingobium sp. FSY-8]|uniref:AlpA family transcriptional regulator n=1 Tax=Novosphingobium ovatum TaxID=1908523 RepID=A0ABW9XFK8_9SPHN|nr:hypothetical protein [Novosphingobium ovatum]NBC37323.1 hypothetical protein [Novosphingobium ovatum]
MSWPAAMLRKTAAAYVDMSEAAFLRDVAAGRLPSPQRWGDGKERWLKDAIDRAITGENDPLPAHRVRFNQHYGNAA